MPRGPRFDGSDYDHARDHSRLKNQFQRIMRLMRDSRWRTLREIAKITGDPEASISAQLRHMRKDRFGSHKVLKRLRKSPGLFEYCLIK